MATAIQNTSVESKSSTHLDDLSSKQYTFSIAALVVMGAALRFLGLGDRALWIDEAFSWAMTRLTWPEFYRAISRQAADMTTYYTALKLWTLFGDSEFVLRSLSAIASVLTIPLVAEVGRNLYSRKAGIVAAAAFTFHLFSIRYAQEARSYALVMFLACISWLLLARIIVKPSSQNWFWFGFVSILAIYSQLIAGLNLATQVTTFVLFAPSKANCKAMLSTIGAIAICLVPAGLYTIHHRNDLSWIQPTHWSDVRDFLDWVAGGIGSRIYLAVVAAFFTVLVIRFVGMLRKQRSQELWAASVPVLGFALPFLGLLVISFKQPTFVGRYIGFVLLPLLWGVGGILAKKRGRVFLASTLLLILALVEPLPTYYREFAFQKYRFQDFQGAVQYIAQQQERGDVLIALPAYARPGLDYYASHLSEYPAYLYPNAGTQFDPGAVLAKPDMHTLQGELDKRSQVWVIVASNNLNYSALLLSDIQNVLRRTHRRVSERNFLGLTVMKFKVEIPEKTNGSPSR